MGLIYLGQLKSQPWSDCSIGARLSCDYNVAQTVSVETKFETPLPVRLEHGVTFETGIEIFQPLSERSQGFCTPQGVVGTCKWHSADLDPYRDPVAISRIIPIREGSSQERPSDKLALLRANQRVGRHLAIMSDSGPIQRLPLARSRVVVSLIQL